MIDTPITDTHSQAKSLASPIMSVWSRWWHMIMLGIITLISIFMNFYQLGQNGFANQYYASAIRSMLDSWHNFFFVSFDPGGFVTVDKPPLGFWLQAASAKIFGFTPFSILLPQALVGVISVVLLYHLVRRHFGAVAGLLAALALALSPISVVTSRNNTIDSTLVLVMLLGAWTVMRAAETGKWRWIILTAVMVGLGFNIKMLEAYLVVPAYAVLYLLASPRKLWMRILQLFVAALIMLAISLSWAVAVDLTPAAQRPYVGSSQDNSEISLALGYNGIQRLLGSFGFGGGNRTSGNNQQAPSAIAGNTATGTGQGTTIDNNNSNTQPGTANNTNTQPGVPGYTNAQPGVANNGNQPPQGFEGFAGFEGGIRGDFGGGFGGGNGGGGGMFNTGTAGPLRLFNEPLGGQIVWLLPLALLAIVALAWQQRPSWHMFRENRELHGLLLWGIWLLTMAVFFSVAGFFHQYYLSTLAPAICALFGIGVVIMWRDYRSAGWRGWLLPLALMLTAAEQIHIILSNIAWGTWLIPIIAITCALVGILLIVVRLLPRLKLGSHVLIPIVSASLIALSLTPAVWSAVPGIENIADNLPTAGPSQMANGGGGTRFSGNFSADLQGMTPPQNGQEGVNNRQGQTGNERPENMSGNFGGGASVSTALISYLEKHQGSAKFLVATPSSNEADAIILATNKPVMALGGFSGSDPILTTSQLSKLVSDGTVRFFLLGGAGGMGGQSSVTSWVTQHCSTVAWQASSSTTNTNNTQLYSCTATK